MEVSGFISAPNNIPSSQQLAPAAPVPASQKRKRRNTQVGKSSIKKGKQSKRPAAPTFPVRHFPIVSDIHARIFERLLARPHDGSTPALLMALGTSKDPATRELYGRAQRDYRRINLVVDKNNISYLNNKSNEDYLKIRHLTLRFPFEESQIKNTRLTWRNNLFETMILDMTRVPEGVPRIPLVMIHSLVDDISLRIVEFTLKLPKLDDRDYLPGKLTIDRYLDITGHETNLKGGNKLIGWKDGNILRRRNYLGTGS